MKVRIRNRVADPHHGLTLVELMVAILVLSILAGVSLPSVKNSLREQKVSRAASLLKSAIDEGRSRAIASGGGGIIIDRTGTDSIEERCQSTRVRFATVPPAYSGDFGIGRATIEVNNAGTPADPTDDTVFLRFANADAPQMVRAQDDIANGIQPTLINIGDVIRMGDAGLPLTIEGIRTATAYPNEIIVDVVREFPNQDLNRFDGRAEQYSIMRSPKPSIAMPIDLPKGSVIDLTASGIGRFGNEFSPFQIAGNYLDESAYPFVAPTGADMSSVWVLFGERGSISRITLTTTDGSSVEVPVTGDVHLLVGRGGQIKTLPSEQLEDDDEEPLLDSAKDGKTPLLDVDSVWVTIKARTGEVLTSPWTDPTDGLGGWIQANRRPAPTYTTPPTLAEQNAQASDVQAVIGRVRSAAVSTRDSGSI